MSVYSVYELLMSGLDVIVNTLTWPVCSSVGLFLDGVMLGVSVKL